MAPSQTTSLRAALPSSTRSFAPLPTRGRFFAGPGVPRSRGRRMAGGSSPPGIPRTRSVPAAALAGQLVAFLEMRCVSTAIGAEAIRRALEGRSGSPGPAIPPHRRAIAASQRAWWPASPPAAPTARWRRRAHQGAERCFPLTRPARIMRCSLSSAPAPGEPEAGGVPEQSPIGSSRVRPGPAITRASDRTSARRR